MVNVVNMVVSDDGPPHRERRVLVPRQQVKADEGLSR